MNVTFPFLATDEAIEILNALGRQTCFHSRKKRLAATKSPSVYLMSCEHVLDYTQALKEEDRELNEDYVNLLWGMLQSDSYRNSQTEHCKFCDTLMEIVFDDFDKEDSQSTWLHRIYSCSGCGWWHELDQSEVYIGEGDFYAHTVRTLAVLRKYEIDSLELPLTTLRKALLKREQLLYNIHPTKMEQLVGSVFADFLDCEVIHLGRSGDGGIDLLLINGDQQNVVQVKRRMSMKATEGVDVIRDLIGAMVLKEQRNGIVVSTANRFTGQAKKAVKEAKRLGIVNTIHLVDMSRFVDILKLTSNKVEMPWESYKRSKLNIAGSW